MSFLLRHTLILLLLIAMAIGRINAQATILALDLQCVVNDNVNGNVTLYWTNPPSNPCGPFIQNTIYASQTGPQGPYTAVPVTSQTASSYTLNGYLAASPVWYFYMEAVYNCFGAIVLRSDTVNNLNPITPLIVNVDVTAGNNVVFNWQPSVSPQTHFYIVYSYLPNGVVIPLDTVYGRNASTYTDLTNDPSIGSLGYTVAAVDSCGKISAYNTLPHNTIYATGSSTACQSQVNLAWTKYVNWPQGVKEYQIWVSTNLGPFANVAAVDSNTLTYSYSGFNDGDSLCIVVRGVSAADTNVVSNSNQVCLKPAIVQPPSYNFITNATVSLDNKISVTWLIDTTAELTFYKIGRSGNNVTYDAIDQLAAPSPLNQFETYIDSVGVLPAYNPYYYQVTAFDSCQNQYVSPFVKTICLKGELYDYYLANLTWNDFELQGATVTQYNLYRNFGNGYQLIKTFPFGVNSYSDSLQQFLNERGIFCYRIEAVYSLSQPTANYQATLSSWSNELCIIHRPIIYIPNAFAPYGVNKVFVPTIIYGEPKGYTMQIYNRYGGLVFESNDPSVGWDGTDHGKEAQAGGYGYLIQFYANDGVKIERKGMVLLVK